MGGVIVASPVRQVPHILRPVLEGLTSLQGVQDVWVYDDNDDPISRELLKGSGVTVLPRISGLPPAQYKRYAETHYWTKQTFVRLTQIKNDLLERARQAQVDLLLVDSDLMLHPQTARHLRDLDAPLVSEVFWTRWQAGLPYLPQVWDVHPGGFKSIESITRLKEPGQYLVNGLGACTFIRWDALAAGVSFTPIPGLQMLGEDRHFSVRAGALGIPMKVDTCHPAFHLYSDIDLFDIPTWEEGQWAEAKLTPAWEQAIGAWFRQMITSKDILHLQGGTEPWITELVVSLAQAVQANRVLELGILRGETTVALARVAKSVIGVDLHLTSTVVNRVQKYGNIRLIEGDATTVVQGLEGLFDLVYIDDGHQYADVKAQTEAVWDKVRPGGLLLFHDAVSPEDNFGVQRYLAERFPQAIILNTKPFPWTGPTGLALVQHP